MWRSHAGIWRWQGPSGTHYRIEFKGGRWHAQINHSHSFPETLGKFDTANDAKSACVSRETRKENA